MANQEVFTPEQVEEVAKRLRNLPKTPPAKLLTKGSVVHMLTREIQRLRRGGYTLAQISEILKESGLNINQQVLRNYLQKQKKQKQKKQAKPKEAKPEETSQAISSETSAEPLAEPEPNPEPEPQPVQTHPPHQEEQKPGYTCPKCGRPLRRIVGKNGPFWGCTGYRDLVNPCTYTVPDDNGKPKEG